MNLKFVMQMNQESYNLRPLQLAILDVFKVFAQICEKHGFKYYAAYGTALGAVRHKGFIPWDDDFDVAMPRDDYNKFVKVVRNELPEWTGFFRGGESKYSSIEISRIVDIRPNQVERLSGETHLNLKNAPFIDIFVLENVPRCIFDLSRIRKELKLWRLCQLWRYPEAGYSVSRKWLVPFVRFAGLLLSWKYSKTADNEDMMLLRDEICASVPRGEHAYEPVFFKCWEARLLPFKYLEPSRLVPFEDTSIRVAGSVEEILRIHYGDYMTLPPPAHRVPEHNLGCAWEHV